MACWRRRYRSCGIRTWIVECVLDRFVHHLEHLLHQVQEWLYSVFDSLVLVSEEIHDGFDYDNAIVLILDSQQAHQLFHNSYRIWFQGLGRLHGQTMEDFEDAVPQFLFIDLV